MPENATTNESNHVTLILRELSDDEKMKYITEMREKALHDEATAMNAAEKRGMEKARAEGLAEGREEGRKARISEIAEKIINLVEKKLLNNYGLKTLAKGEKNYVDIYEGDGFRRDASYHQGITWPWLLGLYYNSLRNMKAFEKDKEKKKAVATKIDEFKKRTEKTFRKEMNESGCIGSISELYDSKSPYLPKGAFAQGWSVAEVFRIIFG